MAAPPCPALVTPAPFSARAPQARLRCAPLSFFQVSQNAFSGLGVCRSEDLAARGPWLPDSNARVEAQEESAVELEQRVVFVLADEVQAFFKRPVDKA